MLKKWCEILPLFIIRRLARQCERFHIERWGEAHAPYRDVLILVKKDHFRDLTKKVATTEKTSEVTDPRPDAIRFFQQVCAAYDLEATGLPMTCPSWRELARPYLEAEKRMTELVRERDQAVQSYAADRERFAAQEERHRVKITKMKARNDELEGELSNLQKNCICKNADECMSQQYARELLAKHGRAGE